MLPSTPPAWGGIYCCSWGEEAGGDQKNRERAHRIENVKHVKTFMNTNISLRTTASHKGYLGLTFQQMQIMQQWVH